MSTPQESKPAAPVALGVTATAETVAKSQRVYEDAPNVSRVALEDGRTAAIQREKRADGTHGPLTLATIRRGNDGTESAQRFPLADIQRVSDALGAAGIVMVAPFKAPAVASK